MARAVARVEQKIIITGADNASDAIRKAQASLGGFQKTAIKTRKSIKATGKEMDSAFDHGLPGLQGKHDSFNRLAAAAGGAGGALQESAHEIALLDAAMRLVPGPVGAAAAAIAGATAVLYLHAKAAREAEARLRQAFSGAILADVTKLKQAFSLTAESAVELGTALVDSGKSAADVKDELTAVLNNADAVGEDGTAAVSKFAASLTKGVTEAQKLTNRLKAMGLTIKSVNLAAAAEGSFLQEFAGAAGAAADKRVASMADNLKVAKQALKDLSAGTRGPLANYKKHLGIIQRIRITLTDNSNIARAHNKVLADQTAATNKQRAHVAKLAAAIKAADRNRSAVARTLKELAEAENVFRAEEAETERQEAVNANAREARDKAQAGSRTARQAAAKRARETAKQAAFGLKQAVAGARALLEYQRQDLETEDLIAQARLATVKGTEAKIAAEKKLIDVGTARQVLDIENSKLDTEDKTARITAVKTLARAELTAKIQAIHTASAAVRKANKEAREREAAEAHAALVESAQPIFDATAALNKSAAALGSAGLGQLSTSLQVAAKGALDLKKNLSDTPKAAAAVAGAVGGIASIAIDAENARTQKTLEAEKKRQLATASTEAERAAIVADFEARKAASVEQAERRKAAILAIMELAKAAAAYPNVPLVAAHVTAAGLFGAVAGGIIGGGAAPAGGAGGAGGGFAAASGGGGAGAGTGQAGGGVTIINNFNQPLVTRQHIGKAVQGALRSIGTTGHAKAKGV
jgi:hypothetical protein